MEDDQSTDGENKDLGPQMAQMDTDEDPKYSRLDFICVHLRHLWIGFLGLFRSSISSILFHLRPSASSADKNLRLSPRRLAWSAISSMLCRQQVEHGRRQCANARAHCGSRVGVEEG